jgi:hypothetical protein
MSDNSENTTATKNHYLGNFTEKKRQSGDAFHVGSICINDIESIPEEHIQHSKTNGKRYVKVILSAYRDGKNEYGNTHSLRVDTFKPDPSRSRNGNGGGNGNRGGNGNGGDENGGDRNGGDRNGNF